jgi:hypothetical protein
VTGAVPSTFERCTRTVPRLPTVGLRIVRNVCSFALERLCIGPPQAVTHFAALGAAPEVPGVVESVEPPPEHDASATSSNDEKRAGRNLKRLRIT